jgi:putative membrane protein
VPGVAQVLDDLGLDLEAGMITAEINTHGQIVPHTCHDGGVSAGLPVPVIADIATRWTVQPVALAVAVIAAGWYAGSVRRLYRSGRAGWPLRRSITFGLGIALLVWTSCGFAQVYSRALFWVWTSQQLLLLLIVPILVMAGQPIELARRTRGDRALPVRLVASPVGRFFANPLVGPVLIPALSFVLFFGPLPGWAIEYPVVGWILAVAIVGAGALIVLPLVSTDDTRGSMAVALALTIGVFELLLDAIPGIVLRLHTTIVTSYFDHRREHSWSPTHLHDQQLGGAILWCVAELIDLPFLLLVYLRWLRADERDAAEIDTVLEAERIARGDPADSGLGAADAPWWLSDPGMRRRLGP